MHRFYPSRRWQVLPTRVGMVRVCAGEIEKVSRSPHPRGDGPTATGNEASTRWFSPPAWGWSVHHLWPLLLLRVLPTRVGMVRYRQPFRECRQSSPHPRGDGPICSLYDTAAGEFSPPAWGWSGEVAEAALRYFVLPTRVGMVRSSGGARGCRSCSPHPRGDGPEPVLDLCRKIEFSPPAWGWSARLLRLDWPCRVLPTRVGMVRR